MAESYAINREIAFRMHPFDGSQRTCVFQCYLDDSYDPPGTGLVTLAGYFGAVENWREFEALSGEVYKRFGVSVFHAIEFKDTKGQFSGWERTKKEDFCVQLFDVVQLCNLVGASKSVQRSLHKSFRKTGKSSHTYSPLSMAFGSFTASACNPENDFLPSSGKPTQFFIENGNANNNGIKKVFNSARASEERKQLLLSLTFVDKDSCHAIQLADFFAYYSRKIAKGLAQNKSNNEIFDALSDPIKIAFTRAPHQIEVACGHVTQDVASRGNLVNVGETRSIRLGPSA